MSRLSTASPLNVLLVEDNPDDIRLVEWAFSAAPDPHGQSPSSQHYGTEGDQLLDLNNLSPVRRLSEAIDHANTQAPDVVLLDLDLPDSRGIETLDRFVRRTPPVPVVVLTGRDEGELGVAAIQRGAQDYIYKGNLTNALLARTIRYAVERHEIQHRLLDATDRLRLTNQIVRRQLRNDISVIVGQVDQLAESDQYSDRSITSILDAARDIEETIDITAEFTDSAVTGDGCPTHKLGALVSTAISRVEQTTGTSIEHHTDSDAASFGCPPSLRMAITSLLYNAVDRTSPSGAVSITTELVDGDAVVTISNTGSELAAEHKTLLTASDDTDVTIPRGNVGLQLASMIISRFGIAVAVRENTPSGSVIQLHISETDR
ncbi:ATP-binding response regulator [Natronorubrum sulfidifaciens]|uniref:ATP-binding response regulator n=1 Tax=Natronorubrum sulfidifaciens TaxID=388259 RepID=UPI0009FFA502